MHMQQKTERRISAALRLILVALLLALQIAVVVALSLLLRQEMYIAYAALELIAIVCAIRIFVRPGGNTYKGGWILLILVVPVVGLILFWLWNGDKPNKKLALRNYSQPAESHAVEQESDEALAHLAQRWPHWRKLAYYLQRQGFPLIEGTEIAYFASGEAYLQDLLEKIKTARSCIFLEYFIIATGQYWSQLREVLLEKAADGVEIKIILDDFGSMMRMPAEEVEELRQGGVEVLLFNPVHQYVNRLYFNYRDHRKIAVIDGNIAYTGGANLADEYSNTVERFGHWKDSGIRMDGQGAWGLCREFILLWKRLGGELQRPWDVYRPQLRCRSDTFCQSLADGPDNNPINSAEDTFMLFLSCACHQVWITTPYLAIDEPMIRAISIAADSGLDVRLMLPGIPDHKFAFMVAESYWGELLHHGVKIYTYTPGFLHGKSVMADGEIAFVGSVNMDYRSFQLHFECGTVFTGKAVKDLELDMEEIMDNSHQVTINDWKQRKWYRKLLGTLLRPFAMWM